MLNLDLRYYQKVNADLTGKPIKIANSCPYRSPKKQILSLSKALKLPGYIGKQTPKYILPYLMNFLKYVHGWCKKLRKLDFTYLRPKLHNLHRNNYRDVRILTEGSDRKCHWKMIIIPTFPNSDISRFQHFPPYRISVKLNYNLEVTGL